MAHKSYCERYWRFFTNNKKNNENMNWEQYAKSLEDIIERIDMADQTRILVNALVERAKKESRL